jgi:hypothetical protein
MRNPKVQPTGQVCFNSLCMTLYNYRLRSCRLSFLVKLNFDEVHDKKESKLFSLASCTN